MSDQEAGPGVTGGTVPEADAPEADVPEADVPEADVIVIGAGFAGLFAVHRLRNAGVSVLGLERAMGVGGVWYWNRYPGARCDIPSVEYSYSFSDELQQEWSWKERYAAQPEILEYLNHVADRFDLRRSFRFSSTVTDAAFDSATATWTLSLVDGAQFRCRHLILAVGTLSSPKSISFPGMDDFKGATYYTSHWPHEPVDFRGKRVAVVGTGSSGVQTVTTIANDVDQLFVLQRTPTYSVPAWNNPTNPAEEAEIKRNYTALRDKQRSTSSGFARDETTLSALDVGEEERRAIFEQSWRGGGLPFGGAFADLITSPEANELAADFLRGKLAAIVKDPETVSRLTPRTYPFGTKRMCVDTGYFEVFNRDNVELIDVSRDHVRFVGKGLSVGEREIEVDAVVMATGFDAMSGSFLKINITADGNALADAWRDGPQTTLGVMSAGFPNLYFITGPGSPSALSNVVVSIEQHVNWVCDAILDMRERGLAMIDPLPETQHAWMDRVAELANATLFPKADSWYMGANIPGKPRAFMIYLGGVKAYADECAEIAREGYRGFRLTACDALSARAPDECPA